MKNWDLFLVKVQNKTIYIPLKNLIYKQLFFR